MTLTFEFTKADYIEAQRMHVWRRFPPAVGQFFFRYGGVLGLAAMVVGACLIFFAGAPAVGALELLVGAYLAVAPLLAQVLLGRRFDATRGTSGTNTRTLQFEPDAIYTVRGDQSSVIPYASVKAFVETPNVILIYVAPNVFIPVPKRIFSGEQEAQLRDLVRSRMVS